MSFDMNLPMPPVRSWSGVLKAQTCTMQYYLEKVLKITSIKPAMNLVYGSALHDGIEGIILTDFEQYGVDVCKQSMSDGLSDAHADGIDFKKWTLDEYILMGDIHLQMFVDWARTLKIETIGTEVELNAVIGDGNNKNRWVAKVDWAFRYRNGRKIIEGLVDHKTCAQPLTDDFKFVDGQLAGYKLLWEQSDFHDPNAVIQVGYTQFKKAMPKTEKNKTRKGPSFIEPDMKIVTSAAEEGFHGSIKGANALLSLPPFIRSASAYNNPCGLCDVRNVCQKKKLGKDLMIRK